MKLWPVLLLLPSMLIELSWFISTPSSTAVGFSSVAILTKIVPESVERSTYVLITSLLLFLMYWKWVPMPETVWSIESSVGRMVLWALFAIGWVVGARLAGRYFEADRIGFLRVV